MVRDRPSQVFNRSCGATMIRPIPLIILAGADRRPADLPPDGSDLHPLSGYKGATVRFDGRPLVEVVASRASESGGFGPIYLAGPKSAYGEVADWVQRIDTDGAFGENLRASVSAVRDRHPGSPVGFITCDVLPEPGPLKELLADYAALAPCDVWYPLVRAPRDQLGSSAWKPAYRIAPTDDSPPVRVLPGHLVIVDTEALRLDFIYGLFQIGYRTRNLSIGTRRAQMVRGLVGQLLYQDLLHLITLRPPTLTVSAMRAGIGASRELGRGTITRHRLEDAFRRLVVRRRHRKRFPKRRVEMPIVDMLSLAIDVDTREEVQDLGGELNDQPA